MKFGKIERIKVYDNRLTYESLGKALVEFESKEDALKCLKEYDQKEFMGHVLDVSFYYTNHKIVRKLANVIITNLDPEITQSDLVNALANRYQPISVMVLEAGEGLSGSKEAYVQFQTQGNAKKFIRDLNEYNQFVQEYNFQERNRILPGNNHKEAQLLTDYKERQLSNNTLMIKWLDFNTRRPHTKEEGKQEEVFQPYTKEEIQQIEEECKIQLEKYFAKYPSFKNVAVRLNIMDVKPIAYATFESIEECKQARDDLISDSDPLGKGYKLYANQA